MRRIGRIVDCAEVEFRTRKEAGIALGRELREMDFENPIVLGVPRGGVPVGYEVAEALGAELDVVVLRKLPIPGNPEAGFGAVSVDGSVVFNEELLEMLRLEDEAVRGIVGRVLEEVRRRDRAYRGERGFPEVKGREALVVDDGIASGFSMVSAVQMLKRHEAGRVIVAVPVAPLGSLETVGEYADDVFCLIGQRRLPFAVASFYEEFPEMSDAEVRSYLDGRPGGSGGE